MRSMNYKRNEVDLKDYINGKRHGKEANRLERDAMNDSFLQDAIDGFDSVPGNHASSIQELEKRLAPQPKRIDKRVWIWAAAAVLVLLIGIPFLLRQPDVKEIQVVSSESAKQEEISVFSPQKDSVLVADKVSPKAPKEEIIQIKPEVHESAVLAEVEETAISHEVPIRETEKLLTAAEDKQVAIPEKSVEIALASNTKTISGKIVDEIGEPIIGATINIKESKIGTVSDIDGNFRLTVPEDEKGTLVASYVGMVNAENPLKENMGDIVMKSDDMALNEVVVTGFGTQRKKTFTGAVAKAKEIHPTFGETEFKQYFEENYDKTICKNTSISAQVSFHVGSDGRISKIEINELSCPALETEIKRLLLGSPLWSDRNRKVTLEISL